MQHFTVRHRVFVSLLARGRVLLVAALLLGTLGAFGIGNTVVNAATLNVSPSGTDSASCGTGTPCNTIGQAVTNANPGDTVNVAAGTYIEQVSINKDLTLTGAGQGTGGTIIQAPAATDLHTNSLGLEVLLDVSFGTVNASGFAVSGPVFTSNACAADFYGIYDRGAATLNLTNVTVSNIRNANLHDFGGCQQGDGIRYGSQYLGQAASGTLDHVTVTGYQKNGITIDGESTTVTLSNSTVTGAGPQNQIGQNGVQISRGAHATVTGNTIGGDECNEPTSCGPNPDDPTNSTQSGAILLYDAGTGTTISNNTIRDSDVGVLRSDDTTTAPSVTVSGNTITNNRYEGVYISGGPTTLSNNTITGPGNVAVFLDQVYTNPPTNPAPNSGTVTYMNNTISGYTKNGSAGNAPTVTSITPNSATNTATTPVTIAGANFAPGATVTVGGLACTGVTVTSSTSLTCTVPPQNTTGAKPVVVTNMDGQSGTLANGFTFNAGPTPMTVYVNPAYTGAFGSTPPGPGTAIGYDAFPTIQAAVNAVAAGGTVNVAAGTYIEQVSIAKSLTLTGAGAANTIIKAPANTDLTTNSLGIETLLDVSGGTVTASAFTVSGPVFTSNACAAKFYGIYDRGGATLNLSNVTVSNIRNSNSGFLGCQQGLAIVYGSQAAMQVAHGTIDHVTVTGYQKNGIAVSGTGTNVTVSNNTVTGDGPQTNIAQNGIEVLDGAVATVTGNTVTANECNQATCGPDAHNNSQSGAILLANAGAGTMVSGNTLSGNDVGVLRGDDNTSFPSVTISMNTITNNRYEGIYLFGGPTTLSNNTITGPGNVAIYLDQDTTTNPATNTGTVTYINNTISGYTRNGSDNGPPVVTSITPNTAANTANTAVTIAGANFTPGATVTVGGQACTGIMVPTSAQITCTVPARPVIGPQTVVVTNPDMQSGTLANGFTFITGDTTQDTVVYTFNGLDNQTAETPINFSVNAKLTNNVTVDPNNTLLRYKATLTRNGAPVTGLSVTYNGGSGPTGGTFMTDSMGNAFFGPPNGFTLAQVPALTSAGGVTTNFTATLPLGGNYTLSVQLIDITTPNSPQNVGAPGSKLFAVAFAVPTITALTPNAVATTGGQEVTVTGTGFQQGARVRINGMYVQTTVVTSDTTLAFTAPARGTGTVTIEVTNPDGKTSNGLTLTYGTISPQPTPQHTPAATVVGATPQTQPATHTPTATAVGATPIPQPISH